MRPRERTPQEELFPFVEMEKLIPENHILRLIDRYVDFSFIHELVEHTYSEDTGRPAVDPELMIRILTIGYLNNLSERKLFEELRMHAAFRWFCNLGFHEPIPDRSTLNKLRNHRWTRDGIFEEIMHRIVRQCVTAGLVKGDHVTVDGTQIEANASIKSLEPIVVEVEVDTYLETLKLKRSKKNRRPRSPHSQDRDFHGETFSNETHRSTTDPDARLHKKSSGQEAKLAYVGNMLIDTKSRVILATVVTQPGVSTETDAALAMIDSLDETEAPEPITTIGGDAGYGSTTFITETLDRGITPHVPLLAKPDHEPIPTWKTATHISERLQKRLKKNQGSCRPESCSRPQQYPRVSTVAANPQTNRTYLCRSQELARTRTSQKPRLSGSQSAGISHRVCPELQTTGSIHALSGPKSRCGCYQQA